MAKPSWVPQASPSGSRLLQCCFLPGTSTPRTLHGDGPSSVMNRRVVDQRVIAIYFVKKRNVEQIENYGLQDGKIFDFISRTTPTSGQELSYLTPLFKLLSFN